MTRPLFSVVVFAWRPELLDRSVQAVLNQTYKNLEIVLVDAYPAQDSIEIGRKITAMVDAYAQKDSRIQVLRIARFKQTLREPLKNYEVACRKALESITGKYFIFQNDDDYLAIDYIEKMVNLYNENPGCVTAAGLPIAVDVQGKETDGPRIYNFRPKFMPGHLMVMDFTRRGLMFASPGCSIFAFDRENFIRQGAYCTSYDLVLLYVVVASGQTGFDESAIFHWVRHEEQFNIKLSSQGYLGTQQNLDFINEYDFKGRWATFGNNFADEVVNTLRKKIIMVAARWFAVNLYSLRIMACWRIAQPVWYRYQFWLTLPREVVRPALVRQHCRGILKNIYNGFRLKKPLKVLFEVWPTLKNRSPLFEKIYRKVSG